MSVSRSRRMIAEDAWLDAALPAFPTIKEYKSKAMDAYMQYMDIQWPASLKLTLRERFDTACSRARLAEQDHADRLKTFQVLLSQGRLGCAMRCIMSVAAIAHKNRPLDAPPLKISEGALADAQHALAAASSAESRESSTETVRTPPLQYQEERFISPFTSYADFADWHMLACKEALIRAESQLLPR